MKAECMAKVLEEMVAEGKFKDMDEAINSVFRDRAEIWRRGGTQRAAMGLAPWTYDRGRQRRRVKKRKTEKKAKRDDEVQRLAEEYAKILEEVNSHEEDVA